MHAAFDAMAEAVRHAQFRSTNDEKLVVYGLFKQVTVGCVMLPSFVVLWKTFDTCSAVCGRDVCGSRPGIFDVAGRAKWDAWKVREGMSKKAAIALYLSTASAQFKKYGQEAMIPRAASLDPMYM